MAEKPNSNKESDSTKRPESELKDHLRKFIEMGLPGCSEPVKLRETAELERFVHSKRKNPQARNYAREFKDLSTNVQYDLKNLQKIGAVQGIASNLGAMLVDFAEPEQSRKYKKTREDVAQTRMLRVQKLILHLRSDSNAANVAMHTLGVKTIGEVSLLIEHRDGRKEEADQLLRFNDVVTAIKQAAIRPVGYDLLQWRNPAKPYVLANKLLQYLEKRKVAL